MTTVKTPKYRDIRDDLESQILAGRWRAGAAFPSETELLRHYPVSRMTIVRSLQELVQAGYLVRHRGKGTFVADLRAASEAAQAVPGQNLTLPFFCFGDADLNMGLRYGTLTIAMAGVREALAGQGITVQLCLVGTHDIDAHAQQLLRQSRARAALVLEPCYNPAFLDFLRAGGCRPVVLNQRIEEVDCVHVDEARAGYLATRHLLELGRRRIAYLDAPSELFWCFGERRAGYIRALGEAGVDVEPALIHECNVKIATEAGRTSVNHLLQAGTRFDAIVACQGARAIGAMAALQEKGVAVPGEVAVVAIDDHESAEVDPPMTAVYLPIEQAAHQATLHAIALLKGTDDDPQPAIRHICVKPSLRVRASTTP